MGTVRQMNLNTNYLIIKNQTKINKNVCALLKTIC